MAAAILVALTAGAQNRRITPVNTPAGKNENLENRKPDMSKLKESVDSKGNIVLIDTVTGEEFIDTTAQKRTLKRMIYPKLHTIAIGVNVWDAAMRALGQHYGLASVKGEISFHNRYKPMFEIGLGTADETPDGNNYTFKSPLAPYFKIGAGYNIFYNSNPDYQLCFNVKYGFTNFSYTVDNVTVDEGYWGDPAHFSLPSQRVSAGYFEIGAGIKVKVAGPVSMGWEVFYHKVLHESRNTYGPPMTIPGFGKRESSISGAFYITYTIPFRRRETATADAPPIN